MPRRAKLPPPPVTYETRETYQGQPPSKPYLDDEYTLTREGERQRQAEEEARRRLERIAHDRELAADVRELLAMWPLPESDDPLQDDAINAELAWRRKVRELEAAEATLSRDPEEWVRGPRMTQTEASLRFALHLIREGHATSDVEVSLTGRELTRAGRRPRFPGGC